MTFAASGAGNCVNVAGSRYIFARTRAGAFVLPVTCAHRGGPLNLARFLPGTTRLVCPWHARMTSVTRALRMGLPAVRRGDRVTAVFPHDEGTAATLEYRPVSPELATERTRTADATSTPAAHPARRPGSPAGRTEKEH